MDGADAVYLVLEQEGRPSRWTQMLGGRDRCWTLRLPLRPGVFTAKLYAQRGPSLIHCGGGDLWIHAPANAAGGVRIDTARLAWSA